MTNKRNHRTLSLSLLTGGIITTIIGIAHIFMPEYGYPESISKAMEPNVGEHFYYLGTYAICGFLLTLGGLSIYFSKIKNIKNSVVVGFFLSLLWIFRAILEYIYPVDLPIFFLKAPHGALFSVILFLAICYTIGFIGGYKLIRFEVKKENDTQ